MSSLAFSLMILSTSAASSPSMAGPTCSVSCSVLVNLEIRGLLFFPGSSVRLFLAGGSPSTSDSSSSLDPFESPSSLTSSGSSSTCEAIKSPRPVKPAFIESLRPSNELLRASAITEPRAAAFKSMLELPSLVLSFGRIGVFPPFWETDVPADFLASFVLLSSLEDFSLPLAAEAEVEGGLSSPIVKNCAEFLSLEQKRAWTKMA